MNWPRLSVIVANYNHGKYLPTCLNAIVTQSVQPFEIVIIDDASTDNSVEIIESFAKKNPLIRFYRNEKNQGALEAALRGLKLAQGEFLCFPAADDEVVPGFFEKSLRLLADHPKAGLSCTASRWVDASTGLEWFMGMDMADRPCYLSPDDLVQVGRRGKLIIPSSSAMMRKEALFEVGTFIPELRWHCDWFANFSCAFRYGMCYVPEPLSDFYLHPTSYYHRGRKSAEHVRVLRTLLDYLSSPQFADIAPRVRDSLALGLFGMPMLRLILQHAKYRQFFTPRLAARALYRTAEVNGKKYLPKPVANWVINRLYRPKKGDERA
jgi:glycosyltransferase involved in cell wall biosynthesis